MKEILREFIIYQVVAVLLAFLSQPDSGFLPSLPSYLVITNCIAWSIRTMFWLASLRLDFLRWRRRWQILIGLPAVAIGCLIGILLAALVFHLFFGHNIFGGALILSIFRGALPGALIVTILILSYYGVCKRLESQALEQERLKSLRARAELAALQSKLNPHFLFNTLNSMLNLVHKEPGKVEEMILGLSDIYRKVLQLPESERISLADEFELARQYLAIEQVRFGEGLLFEVELPDALRDRQVPPLLIQPLVENAVLHGLTPKPGGGHLRLSASREGTAIRIVVEDDGVGFPAPVGEPDGSSETMESGTARRDGGAGRDRDNSFGLASARERLRLLHGEQGTLCVETPPGGGTRVILKLPDDGGTRVTSGLRDGGGDTT